MALMRKCIVIEPSSFQEAVQDPSWVDAMVEEYDSIVKNSAWEIVPRPVDKSVVGSRWIYKGKILIIVLYVDYLILTGDEKLIHSSKEELAKEFEMKDMGLLHYFLGLEIWQRDGELFVSQGKYAREILGKFHMEGCKPMDTTLLGNWRKEDATIYRQLVGSLMYLVNTRPNICYAVNQLSQMMVKPTNLFWKVGKHVLRYLRGTYEYGLWYRQMDELKLHGFTDAYWAGNPMDRKSTSGGIFSIRSTVISWYIRKKIYVVLSLAGVEYMAAIQATCEAIWLR
jgi:hypothetical protein